MRISSMVPFSAPSEVARANAISLSCVVSRAVTINELKCSAFEIRYTDRGYSTRGYGWEKIKKKSLSSSMSKHILFSLYFLGPSPLPLPKKVLRVFVSPQFSSPPSLIFSRFASPAFHSSPTTRSFPLDVNCPSLSRLHSAGPSIV